MSEPLFIPGEVAISRISWTCPDGCGTSVSVGQEVTIVHIIPDMFKPVDCPYTAYAVDIVSGHEKRLLAMLEPHLKKKAGDEPSTFNDEIWNPLKLKETV